MLGSSTLRNLDKEKISNYKEKAVNWGKKTIIGVLTAGAIASPLYTDVSALADEKEVTVPINQVVKTSELSVEQWAKNQVTVPRSWVDQDYLEEHFPQGGVTSQPKARETKSPGEDINNIPDGTLTESPKIIYDENESIDISDFNFKLNYDQGDLEQSTINFSVKNESGNIEDVKLILNGEQQLKPEDGNYDEAVEEFSKLLKGLEEGNLYEGQLKIKGEDNSDLVKFQIYPRMYLNIADDDEINVGAHYCVWYSEPGSIKGADWTGDEESFYRPKLGNYDSRNDEVIAKHIDWATGHGIDTFFIGWWKTPGMNKSVKAFLENPLADEIDYSIIWDGLPITLNRSEFDFSEKEVSDRFLDDMEYLVKNFLGDENYFKVNGDPVICLYKEEDYRGNFPESMKEIEGLNTEINGSGIYWLGENGIPISKQKRQRNAVDGIVDYNPILRWFPWVSSKEKDWKLTKDQISDRYLPQMRENYFDAEERGNDFVPAVVPGFINSSTDFPHIKRSEEGFIYKIEKAKEMMDEDLKTILFTSFNEWMEGTQVEPSKEYGFQYLDIIKDELAGYEPEKELKEKLDHIEFRFNKTVDPGEQGGRKMSIRPAKLEFYDFQNDWDPEFELDLGGGGGYRLSRKRLVCSGKGERKRKNLPLEWQIRRIVDIYPKNKRFELYEI